MSTGAVPPPAAPLRRTRDDRLVAGVCGGLARHLNVDPLIVRIAAIVLALMGGIGALAYVIMVLIIPAEGEQQPLLRRAVDGEERTMVAGLLVLALVLWAIASDGWFLGIGHGWGFGWIGLALIGVLVWLRREDRESAKAAAAPAGGVSAVADAPADAPAFDATAETAVVPPVDATLEHDLPPAPPRPRSGGRIALGATLVGIGVIGAIGALAGDGVRWDVLLACSIIVTGAVLVLAAPFGGARALIPLGLALALVTGIAAAADLDLRGGVGERHVRPATAGELRTDYHLAAGQMTLDLRDIDLPDGVTRVHPVLGFGELVVRVPSEARVQVDAHASGGEIEALGREGNGLDTDVHVSPPAGSTPVLEIDAKIGFGHIAIVRGDQPVPGRHRGPGMVRLTGALR